MGLSDFSSSPLFFIVRLSGRRHRALRCFFHSEVNLFECFVEAAGRNPAAFNKFNDDFLGRSQYLFIDGRHVTAPLSRPGLSSHRSCCQHRRSGKAAVKPEIAVQRYLSGTRFQPYLMLDLFSFSRHKLTKSLLNRPNPLGLCFYNEFGLLPKTLTGVKAFGQLGREAPNHRPLF